MGFTIWYLVALVPIAKFFALKVKCPAFGINFNFRYNNIEPHFRVNVQIVIFLCSNCELLQNVIL